MYVLREMMTGDCASVQYVFAVRMPETEPGIAIVAARHEGADRIGDCTARPADEDVANVATRCTAVVATLVPQ